MKRLSLFLLDCMTVVIVSVCIVGSATAYVYFNPEPTITVRQHPHVAPLKEPLRLVTNKGHHEIVKDSKQ